MIRKTLKTDRERRGVILVLSALMMVALVGLVAFAVDYGYLLKIRTDLQRSADAAALAAVQDLIRKPDGTQDLITARATAAKYASNNVDDPSFQVASADIQFGRYDPSTIYSGTVLLNTGTFDTARVTLRRDGATNPKAPLFFARVLGRKDATITATATAILQKAEYLDPGTGILPFATPKNLWDSLAPGQTWIAYGNGKLADSNGNTVPGDWGTLDIGSTSNSTNDLNNQITDGLRQTDLDALYSDGRIPQKAYIDSSVPASMQGDSGLSDGLKQSVVGVTGQKRLVPIYDQLAGHLAGNNVEIHVVGWGVVTVVDSKWKGATNTYVTLRKSHLYNGQLRPKASLSATSGYIDGAYTSPVLVR
jgi:Flp pilus assembly protein TadG